MSNYIAGLRALVGHRPLIMVGASVMVIDGYNRLLLQQRKDNGCWAYAGGSVEVGERVEDAARRELLEETGLSALELTLYGIFSGPELLYTYPNGDQVSCVDIVYLCRRYTGSLRPQPEEVTSLRFFPADHLPEPLSPPVRHVILQCAGDLLTKKI